ncbi:DUF3231 family protein [Metabacillus litoralis]|uniref:DUF3231 family protein n=1 Tax=Metabacillus litoralis TaxID=152268 RepID=A0A5C6W1B0_9BACI|nr:DUF3231 family protein [Metabacillus litoralis]TXC91055.1 DUF3231 family protein [Metabacillus litoralis]
MDEKNMKNHHIQLTSAEIGVLWTSYITESATLPVLKYFNNIVEDIEIKQIIELAISKSTEHLISLTEIFTKENYPIPIGFSDEDVNVDAPRLFSDTYMLFFLRNLGKAGIAADGMAFSMAARKDIRELYYHYLIDAAHVEDKAKEVMLSKGIFIRPPYISIPDQPDFIEKQAFLRGWFGERRTLTAEEIAHIFMNHTNNSNGKALLIGFSQTVRSEELRSHFIKGIELARSIIKNLSTLLEESTLPAPMTWDTEVNNSTIAPFSDKLMLFHVSALTSIGIGNMGGSLGLSLRRDLATKYLSMIKDIGLYAEDSANIMIKNGWFERPSQAMDREYLSKGKK